MVALDFKKLASLFDKSGLQYQMDDFSVVVTTTLVDGEQIRIYCTLADAEESFAIPRFFLEDDAFIKYRAYPHIDFDKGICAFNHASSTVDPTMIEEAIVSVAIKSIDTLNNTIAGNCMDDFLDDLTVFWSTAGTPLKPVRSFIDKWPEVATVVYKVILDDDKAGISNGGIVKNYRAYKKIHRFTHYGDLLDASKEIFNLISQPALFIPFNEPIVYPIKLDLRTWYESIRDKTDFLADYEAYLKRDDCPVEPIIICSIPDFQGQRTICAFSQPCLPSNERIERKDVKLSDVIYGSYGIKRIKPFNVADVSQQRLFKRGGIDSIQRTKSCLVGCGSLGGHLATALMDSGVTEFALIDKDYLSDENIARHVCGFSHVLERKVDAVKDLIESHNPNCSCKTEHGDANIYLEVHPEKLNEYDVIFITAADGPLEYHFVQKALSGAITPQLVIMWIEPFSLAAHALVLNVPQDIHESLFDEWMQYKDRVVSNSADLYISEAGCSATYMPYSGLDTQAFAIEFVRSFFSKFNHGRNKNKNFHFAWIGALSSAKKYGAIISEKWQGTPDYTSYIEVIN